MSTITSQRSEPIHLNIPIHFSLRTQTYSRSSLLSTYPVPGLSDSGERCEVKKVMKSRGGLFFRSFFKKERSLFITRGGGGGGGGGEDLRLNKVKFSRFPFSLRKHPFLLALRRWGRFARNVPSGEE